MPRRRKNTTTIEADETAGLVTTAKPTKAERACACGCGLVGSGEFRAGHDAVWKSQLLKDARAGNTEARSELIRRGWATDERIDAQPAKASAADVAQRRRAKLEAKLVRARAVVAELEAQLISSQAVA